MTYCINQISKQENTQAPRQIKKNNSEKDINPVYFKVYYAQILNAQSNK